MPRRSRYTDPPPRACIVCAAPLIRRANEYAGNFVKRRTCGGACGKAWRQRQSRIGLALGNKAGRPPPRGERFSLPDGYFLGHDVVTTDGGPFRIARPSAVSINSSMRECEEW